MQGALISDTQQTASYARPLFATLLRHGRISSLRSAATVPISPHAAKQHGMRRVRIQRDGTMAEHNEKPLKYTKRDATLGGIPFRVIVKPFQGMNQKPNWAAVCFRVSAERFRAASSRSDTGVLMAVLTP